MIRKIKNFIVNLFNTLFKKKPMAKRIQLRRDIADNWSQANPVLAQGEIGLLIEDGTSQILNLKVGDGIKNWNDLPYFLGEATNHSHTNLSVLNKFTVVGGELHFDGTPLSAAITAFWEAVSGNTISPVDDKNILCVLLTAASIVTAHLETDDLRADEGYLGHEDHHFLRAISNVLLLNVNEEAYSAQQPFRRLIGTTHDTKQVMKPGKGEIPALKITHILEVSDNVKVNEAGELFIEDLAPASGNPNDYNPLHVGAGGFVTSRVPYLKGLHQIQVLTQNEYDNLDPVQADVLYFIKD